MRSINKHKRWFVFALCLVCVALIIVTALAKTRPNAFAAAAGRVLTPVQSFFTGIFTWCGAKADFVVHLGRVEQENRLLKAEVEALRIEAARLKYADEQAEQLSKLLEVDRAYAEYPKIGARIIAKDPGNWYDLFTIDRGVEDGVEKNMVVLAAGGLAGRVLETGANYAKIVTLVNDLNTVSAKSARTGDTGFARGDAALMRDGKLKMEYIDKDADIAVGDEIVTSHLSSIYPPDITIGYIVEVKSENGAKTAVIEPMVDFRYMDTVLVITKLFEHELRQAEVSP